jgi:hypothetical protein
VDQNFSPASTPIPVSLRLTAPVTKLTSPNQTVALTVTGTFADNSSKDLTRAPDGTSYVISNSDLATVSPDGVVTAKATGNVLVQAVHEGTQGLIQLSIILSGDSVPTEYRTCRDNWDSIRITRCMDDADLGLTNLGVSRGPDAES